MVERRMGLLRYEQLCSRLALAFVVCGSEGGHEPHRPSNTPLRRLSRAVSPHQQPSIPIAQLHHNRAAASSG